MRTTGRVGDVPCERCGHEFETSFGDGEAHLRAVLDHYEEAHDPSWVANSTA